MKKCREHYKKDLHRKAEAYPFTIEQKTRKIMKQPSMLMNLNSFGYLHAKNTEVPLSYLKILSHVCFHSLLKHGNAYSLTYCSKKLFYDYAFISRDQQKTNKGEVPAFYVFDIQT